MVLTGLSLYLFWLLKHVPHYYKFLRPVWVPLRYIIDPIIFLITKLARVIIPEPYRRPLKSSKTLSFKEINEALDEAQKIKKEKARAMNLSLQSNEDDRVALA